MKSLVSACSSCWTAGFRIARPMQRLAGCSSGLLPAAASLPMLTSSDAALPKALPDSSCLDGKLPLRESLLPLLLLLSLYLCLHQSRDVCQNGSQNLGPFARALPCAMHWIEAGCKFQGFQALLSLFGLLCSPVCSCREKHP